MGVTYLYSFLKSIGALRKVYISEEADNYRKAKNKPPVVAIDGINLMYSIYRYYHISWPYGGQLKEYKEHLECFIESFQKEGIDLIFFFDGVNVTFNVDGWIKRKMERVDEIHKFFDKIEYGLSSFDTNQKCLVLPKNIWAITVYVLEQKGCKFKTTIAECDRELAVFGRENDCMAIMATDTDLIIYDTVKIFTTIDMDLFEMCFYVYDKKKILEKLMLRSCELPVFASLAGNDYTQPADAYNKSCKKWIDTERKFYDIAFYIRRLNLKIHYGKILDSDITRISRDFYGNENMCKVLQESINFYDLKSEENGFDSVIGDISDYKWKSIIRMFYRDFHYCNYSLDILTRHCFQDRISLQDFRCTDIPPVSEVLKPLRERWYGILLYEKPGSKTVTEWLINSIKYLPRPKEVSPQFPKVHHPGLINLIRGCNKAHNWTLLGDVFNLDPFYMKNLPQHLLIPALALRYLKDKVTIHKWEINALTLSAIIAKYFNARQLREIKLDKIKSRPIRLYNLVASSFRTVLEIFMLLGNLISTEMVHRIIRSFLGNLFSIFYSFSSLYLTSRMAPHKFLSVKKKKIEIINFNKNNMLSLRKLAKNINVGKTQIIDIV